MSRLRWLCRRGMKELDVVLTRYLEHTYESATIAEQRQFRELLQMPDPDLYNLLLGRDVTDDPNLACFLRQLRIGPGQQ
ncbi:succinate dehydrogenase assembly factor 2 [Pseudomonadota bacterium]